MLAGGTDDKRLSVLHADTLTLLFEGEFKVGCVHVVYDEPFCNG